MDLIYKITTRGAMTFTGNSQGLSKLEDSNTKGTLGSVGAFISLNQDLNVTDFGDGTTFDYEDNGTFAYLDIPENSNILFAYLTWAGTFSYNALDVFIKDIEEEISNPISFTLSNEEKLSIIPTNQEIETNTTYDDAGEILISTIKKYTNSSDVTEYIKKSGGGKYSVESIPAILESEDVLTSSTITAGWTLSVVYENENLPERTMCIWSGLENVDQNLQAVVEVSLDGFQTSKTLDANARLLVSACEGDNDLSGDMLEFGENQDTLEVVSGPNNPSNNFFCSQINNDQGELDTRGSFGTINHDAINGINNIGARQGWDITNVDISNIIKNDQKEAMIRLSTQGDVYSVNTVGLQIDTPQLTTDFYKTSDKNTVNVGDVVTYTATITNTDTENLVDIIFTDKDLIDTVFVENSVKINDVSVLGVNPNDGFSLGSLDIYDTVTVSFSVIVVSALEKVATNIAIIEKQNESGYIVDQNSNEVEIVVVNAQISNFVKSVNQNQAVLGDVLTYQAEFQNTGDVAITDVILTDITTNGVSFVENSLVINDKEYQDSNIEKGVSISEISIGEKVTISFEMEVISSDYDVISDYLTINYNYLLDEKIINETSSSNEILVEIIKPKIEVIKTADKNIAVLGNIINYSFKISNTGNMDLINVDLTDLLDQNLAFVDESVIINGKSFKNQNPTSKIMIGDLFIGNSIEVSFDAEIINNIGEKIENQATVTADYISKDEIIKSISNNSNICEIKLRFPSLEISKKSDVDTVFLGDTINYSVTLENTGDTDLKEVLFKDYISTSVEFIEGSFILDGEVVNSINLEQGVLIGDISTNQTANIEYSVKVISGSCDKKIKNTAKAIYNFEYDGEGLQTGETDIATVTILSEISNFKQISLNSKVTIPNVKPDIKTLDNVDAKIEIKEHYVIDVISGVSNEGQRLYGKKLIVHGELNASIEYTEPCDSVHSAHWSIPFTTYIVLPKDYAKNKIDVGSIIEKISSVALNSRELEINTLLLVVASIK